MLAGTSYSVQSCTHCACFRRPCGFLLRIVLLLPWHGGWQVPLVPASYLPALRQGTITYQVPWLTMGACPQGKVGRTRLARYSVPSTTRFCAVRPRTKSLLRPRFGG